MFYHTVHTTVIYRFNQQVEIERKAQGLFQMKQIMKISIKKIQARKILTFKWHNYCERFYYTRDIV